MNENRTEQEKNPSIFFIIRVGIIAYNFVLVYTHTHKCIDFVLSGYKMYLIL